LAVGEEAALTRSRYQAALRQPCGTPRASGGALWAYHGAVLRRRLLQGTLLAGTGAALWAWVRFERLMAPSALGALEGGGAIPRSDAAQRLVDGLIQDLGGRPLLDVHAHLAGRGPDSGCWTNPRLDDPTSPVDLVRGRAFRAAGLPAADAEDEAWVDHLGALAAALPFPSEHHLLAFDYRYGAGGERDLERSEFHVPNDWSGTAAARWPSRLAAAGSVHPDRPDALEELDRLAEAGVRLVKWLPSAMGIDPAAERHQAFYERLAERGLWLLVHTGEERAVGDASEADWNQPLRLRSALRAGARVVVGHCAAGGAYPDPDVQGAPRTPAVELFLRLLEEFAETGRVAGEISTVCNVNHFAGALPPLLARPDLHQHLLNGSDWPLPAVGPLVFLSPLVRSGFLPEDDLGALRELFDENPLLFDVVLKHRVRHPETGERFGAQLWRSEAWG